MLKKILLLSLCTSSSIFAAEETIFYCDTTPNGSIKVTKNQTLYNVHILKNGKNILDFSFWAKIIQYKHIFYLVLDILHQTLSFLHFKLTHIFTKRTFYGILTQGDFIMTMIIFQNLFIRGWETSIWLKVKRKSK